MTSRSLVLVFALWGALSAQAATAGEPGTFQAIRDCVLDGDLDRRYPPELLRRAQRELPSDQAEYGNCAEVLGAAILDSGADDPAPGRGAEDGSEPGRSATDREPGRSATDPEPGRAVAGRQLSVQGQSGAPGSAGDRSDRGERPEGTPGAGSPWLWLVLAGLVILAASGLLFRERLTSFLSGRLPRGRHSGSAP